MLTVLRRRNFAFLWVGGLVSSLGDWFLFIALPFYVYELTGSALATGVMFIVETLPSILFGSLAGVFVDRWDRRRTMIVADLSRSVVLLPMLLARSPETIWIIYLVSFVQASIGLFFTPARNALVPRIVDEDDLMQANSVMAVSNELTRLIGPTVGGALMGLLGLTSVILADSASFLFSAVMVGLISVTPGAQEAAAQAVKPAEAVLATVWRDFVEGLALVRQNRLVSVLLVVMAITMVGQGIINVLIVPFVKDVLHGDALVLGWVASAQGVGGLVGGLLISQIGARWSPPYLVAAGLALTGIFIVGVVHAGSLVFVLALIGVAGLAVVAFVVSSDTLLQRAVEDRYRGRVFGAYGTIQSALMLGGMGVAAALGGIVGAARMLDVAGVLTVVAGIIAGIALPAAVAATLIKTEAEPVAAQGESIPG